MIRKKPGESKTELSLYAIDFKTAIEALILAGRLTDSEKKREQFKSTGFKMKKFFDLCVKSRETMN